MFFIDVLEEPQTRGRVCFICGAGQQDSHWSNCPFGEGDADSDPDADSSEQSAELS
jgi:hypothetical protein